jgi:hypothetical protein
MPSLFGQKVNETSLLDRNVYSEYTRLKLSILATPDSVWQVWRGQKMLSDEEVFAILNMGQDLHNFNGYKQNIKDIEFKSRAYNIASVVGFGLGILLYVSNDSKDFIGKIPSLAIIALGSVTLFEGFKIQNDANKQAYYLYREYGYSKMKRLIDAYNEEIYNRLAKSGLHFDE